MDKVKKRRLTPGKRAIVLMVIVAAVVGIGFGVFRWLTDDYPATATAQEAIRGDSEVRVDDEKEYYHFYNEEKTGGQGIIFYPGAKVDEAAYAPMLLSFADEGYEVYLMKMPMHIAIFKKNAADLVIGDDDRKWIMMGHSLGGTYAADYAGRHRDRINGLVLLAAYSAVDLSDVQIPVLSIYGSRDEILNKTRYEDAKANLPKDMTEYVIDGGNHAGFGYYGMQTGDGEASITRKEQQEEVLDLLTDRFGSKNNQGDINK